MAEERRLEKIGGHGTGVYGNKRPVVTGRIQMQRFGDDLLAGTAFALQQHGGAAIGNLGDEVKNFQHRLALADDVFEIVALFKGALELDVLFFPRGASLYGGTEHQQEVFVGSRGFPEQSWQRRPAWRGLHFLPYRKQ